MKNEKIAIVCNSTNSDLVEYFKCKVNSLSSSIYKDRLFILKNIDIKVSKNSSTYNSSYTKSAFFDKKVPLDFFKSFYLFFILILNKVKVIHFTTAHVSNVFLSLLLKPFRVKQIFTIHDLVPHPSKKAIFIRMYNNFVINFLSDEIISFSNSEITKQKKKDKFTYMNLSGFAQFIKEPKIGNKTILFFGRIESYKGLNNLLDLIKKAYEAKLEYKFIIAGKGNIDNVSEFKKYNNVKVINRFIDDNEVQGLFRKATFTILPYDSATQSGVTILSYAYATPVIAYDVGALGEYIEEGYNGFIVEYKNNDAIIKLLKQKTNNEIKNLSKNIINDFKEKFSKEACKKLYLNYYTKQMEDDNDKYNIMWWKWNKVMAYKQNFDA